MNQLKISHEAKQRYFKSVLKNLHEFGFSTREVLSKEGSEGQNLTFNQTADLVFDLSASHVRIKHTGDPSRKIGLLVVLDADTPPAELIVDYGACNAEDMKIADRCVEGGTSA